MGPVDTRCSLTCAGPVNTHKVAKAAVMVAAETTVAMFVVTMRLEHY